MVKTCSYPEHYFCRENTIFIGKVTDTAVFVGNVADGFDSYAVSGTFGGLENIVFLPYFTIESISPHESEADDYGGDKPPH